METITLYSYKGGTGRTLVVANVARYLRLFQRLIKPEVIRPHLSPLIEQAKQIAFDDPDRAQE